MNIAPEQMKTLLLGSNLITEAEFANAETAAVKNSKTIEEYVVEVGLMSDEHLGKLVANYRQCNYVDVSKQKIPDDILHYWQQQYRRELVLSILRKNREKK